MEANTYCYEQPTDELTRLCLRLENLFTHLEVIEQPGRHTTHLAIQALSHLINATDRSDINSKLQELCSKQKDRILFWQRTPGVDLEKIEMMLDGIKADSIMVKRSTKKPGETLRQNPFFNTLRSHVQSPNGLAPFNSPQYNLWIKQPEEQIKQCLQAWADEFAALKRIVQRSLQFIRSNAESLSVTSQRGLYQHSLDPSNPHELFRIRINSHCLYPSISVSQHQLNIQLQSMGEKNSGHAQKSYANEAIVIEMCQH